MIVTIDDHRLFVPQRNQPLVIIQDGVFVPNLCFRVDCAVIAVYSNPGRAVGKAGISELLA